MSDQKAIDEFHRIYYESGYHGGTWKNTRWLGVEVEKLPLDLWLYQEILYEIKPDLIIECGTFMGGSALFLASICDLLNNGRIVTVDIQDRPGRPRHHRIEYVTGNSVLLETVQTVKSKSIAKERVLVVLDSNHFKQHVLEEMRLYSPLVSIGSYLIVEDGNINGHPVNKGHGPGPSEAIEDFLQTNKNFSCDESKSKFLLSFNPRGYLKRIS